jgi:thiol-disulfide isomerase/thioredoxin
MSGAVRCNAEGEEDDKGSFFKGVEFRCIGSVEENINSITIYPLGSDRFQVHFGSRKGNDPQGIWTYTGDSHSLLQLDKLAGKDYVKYGFTVGIRSHNGADVFLNPRAIRRASKVGKGTGYDKELILYASIRMRNIAKALEAAEYLSRTLSFRFGLELECYKIGKKYGNFFILRNDNFDDFLNGGKISNKGLVFFTATSECRRCRREIETFQKIAEFYPDITFALVNIATPQFKFYDRVFGDMGGGDPNTFRYKAVGSTPFTIIYKPDQNRVLDFAEYYGTEKAEAPPSFEECVSLIDKHLS